MILKGIGLLFLGLAILGVALPVLPTTPFVLVAAACFAKSSPRLHQKLLENKIFGPLIINWQTHKIISLRSKVIALTTMLLSFGWSFYIIDDLLIVGIIALLMIGPFIYVARLATAPKNGNKE